MINFKHCAMLQVMFNAALCPVFALHPTDQADIEQIIQGYTNAWNQNHSFGFTDNFSENADFVYISGSYPDGWKNLESNYLYSSYSTQYPSTLEISNIRLHETEPCLVIGVIDWRLNGFFIPAELSCFTSPGTIHNGVSIQVFINNRGRWNIIASQDILIPSQMLENIDNADIQHDFDWFLLLDHIANSKNWISISGFSESVFPSDSWSWSLFPSPYIRIEPGTPIILSIPPIDSVLHISTPTIIDNTDFWYTYHDSSFSSSYSSSGSITISSGSSYITTSDTEFVSESPYGIDIVPDDVQDVFTIQ